MNLLIISTEFLPGPGGIGTHAYQVARNMNRIGWTVKVVTRQDYVESAECVKFNQEQNFDILSLPELANGFIDGWSRWLTLVNQIRTFRPDLILATGSRSMWISAFLPFSIPIVLVGHGTEFGLKGWPARLTRYAIERADHVICVSEFTRQYIFNQHIHPKRTSVINNGADEHIFKVLVPDVSDSFRARQGFTKREKILLTVGNVTERKGQDIVIRALSDVCKTYPDTHYLIAGLPTERERFLKLAHKLGIDSNVHFLGRVSQEDLVNLYNICDLFLMTSRKTNSGDFEGYGIAVLEAALCEKPAIVTGKSGLEEAVVDGETGIVIEQEDHAATAQAILKLLEDDALRCSLGRNARENALTNQTWSNVALRYDQLFRSIIAS